MNDGHLMKPYNITISVSFIQVLKAGICLVPPCDMCSNYEQQLQGVQAQEAETRDQVWPAYIFLYHVLKNTRGHSHPTGGSTLPSRPTFGAQCAAAHFWKCTSLFLLCVKESFLMTTYHTPFHNLEKALLCYEDDKGR